MPTLRFEPSRASIFMSPEGGDSHWRLMEKLAAIFELLVNPKQDDIFTFSSAQVPDCISSSEQVDVAYSYVPDPSKFFSFVEVRDRNANIGRGYIQEVMGKRKSLAVEDCCVVSTKGFAPDALKLALHEGIHTRTIEISESQKSSFFGLEEFIVEQTAPDILRCDVAILDVERHRTGSFAAIGSEVFERALLGATNSGKLVSVPLWFFLDKVLASGGWDQLEAAKGKPIQLGLKPNLSELKLRYTENDTGLSREVDVLSVVYTVRTRVERVKLPRGKLYNYKDAMPNKLLAEAILFTTSGQRTAVCMAHTLDGPHRATTIVFLNEQELSELMN